jgi:hypothetical protein
MFDGAIDLLGWMFPIEKPVLQFLDGKLAAGEKAKSVGVGGHRRVPGTRYRVPVA